MINPHSLFIALSIIVVGFFPALFWLWFWLHEDSKKPEPKGLIWQTFIVGGLMVFVAFALENAVARFGTLQTLNLDLGFGLNTILSIFAASPIFFLWSLIEEVVKFVAVYLTAFRRRYFDEPVDAIIYMITGALGFSGVENALFLFNTLLSGENISTILFTGNLRFIGATILHTISSAALGCFLGLVFYRSRWIKLGMLILGLITATALHAMFNFFIIVNEGKLMLPIFVLMWSCGLALIMFFEKIKNIKQTF